MRDRRVVDDLDGEGGAGGAAVGIRRRNTEVQVDDIVRVGAVRVIQRAVEGKGIAAVRVDVQREDRLAVRGAGVGAARLCNGNSMPARGERAAREGAASVENAAVLYAEGAGRVVEEIRIQVAVDRGRRAVQVAFVDRAVAG